MLTAPAGTDVVLAATRRNGRARLSVTDFGTGIRRGDLERVFEPFFTSDDAQGSGLGLSIVHGIVERHGGTIEVDSLLGRGTTFTVTLPRGRAHLPDDRIAAAATGAGHDLHVNSGYRTYGEQAALYQATIDAMLGVVRDAAGELPVEEVEGLLERVLGPPRVLELRVGARRPGAEAMREAGIARMVMVTGDHIDVAETVGAAVGVDDVRQ